MKQLLDGYIDLILQTVSNCRGGGRDGRREWKERGGLGSMWEGKPHSKQSETTYTGRVKQKWEGRGKGRKSDG